MKPYVVLYNDDDNVRGGDASDAVAASDAAFVAEAVAAALGKLGPVDLVATGDGDPERLVRKLKACDPRVVFNLAEAARGIPELEACVAGVLELLGLAYTGSPPQTLALCLDKPKAKALLHGSGIAVPVGIVLRDAERDDMSGLRYPVIVKPAAMDASHGIEPTNVCWSESTARAKAAELIARFPPAAIVERFIDGREFNVGMVQFEQGRPPLILPLGEIDWRLPDGVPRVLGFAAKWDDLSESYERTPVTCPATVWPELERRIHAICHAAFDAVGACDYARVDIRVDADEQPFVIEINPNPCISPRAGLAAAAAVAGISYDELIRRVVDTAEQRGSRAPFPRRI
jgi:D-alanine-D-alanine ligase